MDLLCRFDELFQVPVLYQLFQERLICPAVLDSMPNILVVSTLHILVSGGRITQHLGWPFEEGFPLDFVKQFVDGFFEHKVNSFERTLRRRYQSFPRKGILFLFPLWGEIPSFAPHHLVLDSRILVDPGHQFSYITQRLLGQGSIEFDVPRETEPKRGYCHDLGTSLYLIYLLLVTSFILAKSLSLFSSQGQQ
ncbi:unnamed protein product [Ilex paraguariensis]|uniref:Uncharacterized protein n=1 Tax=Ilex paraguariensis TaxID=185542 RepID=A0ABC8U696_9AQUA